MQQDGDREEPTPRAPEPQTDERAFWHRYGRRIAVGVAGFLLIVVGIILALPLVPGPGTVLILAGLALLATEFDWAERRLEWAKKRFEGAARRAGVNPRLAAVGGLVILFIVTAGGILVWLVLR
jgi:uncharacterized protein (TIGR02611 family)